MTRPRSQPYTAAGLLRRPCAHCGKPAKQQWSLRPCAIGRVGWYPLCTDCDVKLNAQVMEFLKVPDRGARLAAYTCRNTAVPDADWMNDPLSLDAGLPTTSSPVTNEGAGR